MPLPKEVSGGAQGAIREAWERGDGAGVCVVAQRGGDPWGGGLPDTLRGWIRQARVDTGERPGVTTGEAATIKALEREVRELKRANEILLAASSFFARELE